MTRIETDEVNALLWADMEETLLLAHLAFTLALRSAASVYALSA